MVVELKDGKVNLEALKDKTALSEDEINALAKEALEEIEPKENEGEAADKSKDQEPAKSEESEAATQDRADEELMSLPETELTDSEKAKKQELVKAKEDEAKKEEERILAAKDEELNADEKVRRIEMLKVKESEKAKAFEEEAQAYAKEDNISIEDAKEDLEHISKIREKYKDDTKQLAKANLNIQRLSTKLQNELKALKENPPLPPQPLTVERVLDAVKSGQFKIGDKALVADEVVEKYRAQYPRETETADDEAVLLMASKEIKFHLEAKQKDIAETQSKELSEKATEKKKTLLAVLPEADKKFVPIIEPLLAKMSPAQITSEHFSVVDMLKWAKGDYFDKNYNKDVKEAEERGYKRGVEEAKIIGKKSPIGEGKTKTKTTTKRTLNDSEKRRALEMFDTTAMTEEQKYDAYLEIYEEEKK